MLDINTFIKEYITKRPVSMFVSDIRANREQLTHEIEGQKVLVIGGSRYDRFFLYTGTPAF